jgi:hypothetical protein
MLFEIASAGDRGPIRRSEQDTHIKHDNTRGTPFLAFFIANCDSIFIFFEKIA